MIVIETSEQWEHYKKTLRGVVYHDLRKNDNGYSDIPFYPCIVHTELQQSMTDRDVYFARHDIERIPDESI